MCSRSDPEHFWLGVGDFGPPAPDPPEKRNLRLATVCENPALGHPSKKPVVEQGENRKARLNCLNHSTKSLLVPAVVGADAGGLPDRTDRCCWERWATDSRGCCSVAEIPKLCLQPARLMLSFLQLVLHQLHAKGPPFRCLFLVIGSPSVQAEQPAYRITLPPALLSFLLLPTTVCQPKKCQE